jgi:hypothetical protein
MILWDMPGIPWAGLEEAHCNQISSLGPRSFLELK